MTLKSFMLAGASAFAVSLCAAAPAFAEDAATQTAVQGTAAVVAAGQAAAADAAPRRLDTVTVSATRREESAQDIPVAVSSFSPVQIQAANLTNTVDLVRFTPGMTGGFNTGTGGAVTYFIRGLGSTEQVATFDAPVATYVDEIYFARQSVNSYSLFDIERVEVARGPQGTLFGRNTTGGAVIIVNKKPADEFGFFVEGTVGSYNQRTVRGSIDVPVSDNFLTKLSAFYTTDDGYVTNTTTGETMNGEEGIGARGAITWRLSDTLTWDLSADWLRQDKTTIGQNPLNPKYISRSGLRQTECDDNIISIYTTTSRGNCSRITTGGLTSNIQWDVAGITVNFITGYRSTDQDFALDFFDGTSPRGGFVIANEVVNHQWSQEIKLAGENDLVRWVGGLFYLGESNKNLQLDSFAAGPINLVLGSKLLENEAEVLAVYAQGDFKLAEDLTLTVGGRLTNETKDINFVDANRPSYGPGFVPAAPPPANRTTSANLVRFGIPLSQEETKFTPRVALSWQVDTDKLIFVSATNGFKSGGWNGRDNNAVLSRAFGPEEVWSYELGAKTEWFDGLLRLNVTGYFAHTKDLQVLSGFPNPVTGAISFVTQNAADLESMGVEFELTAAPSDYVDIFASLNLSDGRYKNAEPGPSCRVFPEAASCVTERDEPVRYPDVAATLGGAWRIPAPMLGGEFSLSGAVSYQSPFWTSTSNDTGSVVSASGQRIRFSSVPATTILNGGITYRADNGNWLASLQCSNCGEEFFFGSSLVGVGYPPPPRRVTFSIKYTY
jgi:iron complex outermembrane receptor protein